MAYIGQGIKNGTFTVLDTSGNTYNGSNVTFSLGTQVGSPAQLLVSHDGVIQKPGTDYILASGGTQITFTTAPASGASIFIVEISGAVGGPINGDLDGAELVLDTDGDTSITADTDDQIDIKIAGTDQITIKDGALSPVTDNDIDLGTSSLEFKDAYFDGTVTSDAGLFDTLGVTSAKDLGTGIHIKTADSGGSVDSGADELVIEGSGDAGMTILTGTSNTGAIRFGDSGGNTIGGIQYNHTDNECLIRGNNATCISAGATVVVNDDSADMDFRVESNGNTHMIFVDAGSDFVAIGKNNGTTSNVGNYFSPTSENHFTVGAATVAVFNREDNGSGQNFDGAVVAFRANNSEQGTISISGSTTSYNAFSGAHWGRLSDNSAPTILRGTVIESIATMIDWYVIKMTNSDGYEFHEEIALPNGKSAGDTISHTAEDGVTYNGVIEKQMNEQLPMTKISDTEDSKAVYGVFNSWDNEPDDGVNDMLVTGLGAFIVRIHKDETVAIGDLLSSKGDGTAKKQADDILRASTIAKVTSTTKIETYSDGSYCVPCTLHCG